jgi:penicillin G amidase
MPRALILAALLLPACGRGPDAARRLAEIPARAEWELPLRAQAHVVYTEGGVPHVYAEDRRDLAMVWGFTIARDRFFMMDLSRRLALGTLSEVLGADALRSDMSSRAEGNRQISEATLALVQDHHPELLEQIDAYVLGVNAYVDAVAAGRLPAPSEYVVAAPLLGAAGPSELIAPFDRLSVVAGAATVLAMSGFDASDVQRGLSASRLDGWYDGADLAELRQAGLRPDFWDRVEPGYDVASAPDWVSLPYPQWRRGPTEGRAVAVPVAPAERILARRAHLDALRGRDAAAGFGSNAWAVHADGTVDGRALLAGDGHLGLTIPPLFYSIGLDTSALSGTDDLTFTGMAVPGLPVPGPGTNGHIAWSQIAFFGDLTDWYREEIQLDPQGRPTASRFAGDWRPLVAHAESAVVRDVPLLGSVGRTERWERFTTFDGRWIADIEGRAVGAGYEPAQGETVVRMGSDRIVPADTDGDGVITAISFDYGPLDGSGALVGLWGFADARSVDDFQLATKDLVGNSAGLVAADRSGSVLYTGMEAVPCRSYLPRNADGSFIAGADPRMLLDGTRYGGFSIPYRDGHVDYDQGGDAARCLIPIDGYPHSKDPAQRFVVAANNDPSGQTFDGDLTNDGWYLGGPWLEGARADTISRELAAQVSRREASVETMSALQANHDSRMGEWLVPVLQTALFRAERGGARPPETPEGRMGAIYAANAARFDEARDRLLAWAERGYQARSGVETFYHTPAPGDAEDAVATMIFNAWYGRFLQLALDDERLPPGTWQPTGDSGRLRFLRLQLLEGRGADNPLGLAGFNPVTGEHVAFDIDGTPQVETSDELMIMALARALDFLTSPPTGPGEGGFGTADMGAWLWGLRHGVRFESILASFLGNDPAFASLTNDFSITPRRIPIADGLTPNDPRRNLPGFPRHADQLAVDAGNPGTSGVRFGYTSGPVFRLVVSLGPDGPRGVNVLPGGNSGLNDSPNFDDQARLWLGNETLPLRFSLDEVLEGAVAREGFSPE